MNWEKIIGNVFVFLLLLVTAVAFIYGLNGGIKASEKSECERWLEQSAQYPEWYSTDWQRQQCKQYHIEL